MSGENDYQVFDLNRAPGSDIDVELKKIQLVRERLALEDELRKRDRREHRAQAVRNGVGRVVAAMDRKTAQWDAERQQREEAR
jgi:hypothetical protein